MVRRKASKTVGHPHTAVATAGVNAASAGFPPELWCWRRRGQRSNLTGSYPGIAGTGSMEAVKVKSSWGMQRPPAGYDNLV